MATSKVRLNICGSSYVIATSESEDYMQNLADRLNLDMNELMSSSKSVSITTAAVMTALSGKYSALVQEILRTIRYFFEFTQKGLFLFGVLYYNKFVYRP